jgi:hypothetical protein
MPFLVPATVALLSDVTVVVLHFATTTTFRQSTNHQNDHWVYHAGYCWWTSLIRLFLLVVPLYYHSYTGTAVHLVRWYRFFYGGCLVILGLHMLALAMLNPESLESIFFLANSHFLRDLWWMLCLSFLSTLCHTVVLQHVRSTGPPEGPVPTLYFAVRTANQLWNNHHHHGHNAAWSSSSSAMGGEETPPPAYIHAMNGRWCGQITKACVCFVFCNCPVL